MTNVIAPTPVLLPADLKPIESLSAYIALGGLEGLKKAKAMTPHGVIEYVTKSGLKGRGGAGFPTGIKWTTVASDPFEDKYVVCNAAEGEPGTYKDRYLISKNPYLLLEGVLIASYAINAKAAVVGIKQKFTVPLHRLKEALKEFEENKVVRPGFIEIFEGPDDYLFGEEKGLIETISFNGSGPMPRVLPPYLLGLNGIPASPNPTIVNNAETFSHLPLIFNHGIDWFRSRGSADTPGTMIITLSGDVKRPGLYEISLGITLRQLLEDIGGGPIGGHPFKAVFSGAASPVVTPEQFDAVLDFGSMRKAGGGLGSGGFIVLDASSCMVKAALMFSRFLAKSSCGQCVPCHKGTAAITQLLEKIENQKGSARDIENIFFEAGKATNQTRCFLPAQEANLVPSVVRKFSDEFKKHFNAPCPLPRQPILPKIKSFDEQKREFVYENQN